MNNCGAGFIDSDEVSCQPQSLRADFHCCLLPAVQYVQQHMATCGHLVLASAVHRAAGWDAQRAGAAAAHDGVRALWRPRHELVGPPCSRAPSAANVTRSTATGLCTVMAATAYRYCGLGPWQQPCRTRLFVACRRFFGSSGHKQRQEKGVLQVGCCWQCSCSSRSIQYRLCLLPLAAPLADCEQQQCERM